MVMCLLLIKTYEDQRAAAQFKAKAVNEHFDWLYSFNYLFIFALKDSELLLGILDIVQQVCMIAS